MLELVIVTPERKVIGPVPVASVTLPGSDGQITILPGHARLLSLVGTGLVSFEREGGRVEYAAVSTGFLEVYSDKVKLLADTLELAQEIDVDRARRALEKAQEKLRAKQSFDEEMVKWQRKLERAGVRQLASEYLLPR